MALIFVNGAEEDTATLMQTSSKACLGAYNKLGFMAKRSLKDFDIVAVHVLDLQTLLIVRDSMDKYGINYFLATNDDKNPDPRKTVLAVGPVEPERLNKMSAGLRLF